MWKTVKLGEVATFTRGLTYSKNNEVEFSDTAVLRATNIDLNSYELTFNEIRYVSSSVKVKEDQYVRNGDILICTASGSKSHLGKVAYLEGDLRMAFGGFMAVLRCKNDCLPRFLFRILTSRKFKQTILGTADGANINNLKFSQFKDYEFPLPPLAEQQRIVEKLDRAFEDIDRAIEATERKKEEVDKLKSVVLAHELTSFSGSKIVKLSDVCDFQNGFAFKSNLFRETGTPVVRISNIQQGIVDFQSVVYVDPNDYDQELSRYMVKPNDLLIAMSGATTGKIGFNTTGLFFYQNQRVGNFKPKETLDINFLFYFLTTKIEDNLRISKGSAQPNLSTEQINNIQLSLPTLTEQQRIVGRLDQVFSSADEATKAFDDQLSSYKALKSAILAQELKGPES